MHSLLILQNNYLRVCINYFSMPACNTKTQEIKIIHSRHKELYTLFLRPCSIFFKKDKPKQKQITQNINNNKPPRTKEKKKNHNSKLEQINLNCSSDYPSLCSFSQLGEERLDPSNLIPHLSPYSIVFPVSYYITAYAGIQ